MRFARDGKKIFFNSVKVMSFSTFLKYVSLLFLNIEFIEEPSFASNNLSISVKL